MMCDTLEHLQATGWWGTLQAIGRLSEGLRAVFRLPPAT
jgi:hypothetical protein